MIRLLSDAQLIVPKLSFFLFLLTTEN